MSQSKEQLRCDKEETFTRGWLYGKEYYVALACFDYAAAYHNGLRKDKKTPALYHQICGVHRIRTLHKDLLYPEATIAGFFIHDTAEDFNVSFEEIEQKFGKKIADANRLISKKHRGVTKDDKDYYAEMAKCPIASIQKGADREHNLSDMKAFTKEKKLDYCKHTEEFVLPMLSQARKNFPSQDLAYESLKISIKILLKVIRENLEVDVSHG